MKRFVQLLFLIFFFLTGACILYASEPSVPSFSANLGFDFFNYSESYLNMGITYNHPLADGLELSLGSNFALLTKEEAGSVVPYFFIPLDIGLNFIFSNQFPTYLIGFGVSPVLRIPPNDTDVGRFYMGPFLKAGVRLRVHKLMNIFFNVYQDLLIGKPNWINTTTRIRLGINFRFTG